ncbi:MAG: sugar transferase [Acidobacteriaceae bacterium]
MLPTLARPSFTGRAGNTAGFGLRPLGFLNEQEFLNLLCLERRRTERSGKPFLLMLLDCGKLFSGKTRRAACEDLCGALTAGVRNTDLVGWFKEGSVLAVLFSEVERPGNEVAAIIRAKIKVLLQRELPAGDAQCIVISVHEFPESELGFPECATDLTVYPDLRYKAESHASGTKRVLDIVISSMFLLLLLPLLLAIGILVKLTSEGPALFQQERVGQYARPFVFLKFRTMYVNSASAIHNEYISSFIAGEACRNKDETGNNVFKITNDPRVTRAGRFLRKTSLDELPQFWNVLRGQMSLVGPRPPLPYEVAQYRLWHLRRILEARPGITGLWQISGRSRLTFEDMVRLDLKYAREASLGLDMSILLKTPMAIFSGEGAY